jgi:hypothetical protein
MTKVLVFGENSEQKKKLTPIELAFMIDCNLNVDTVYDSPSDFEYIMLLERGYTTSSSKLPGYDLMMAWDFEDDKALYLGHWNDGVV